MKKQEPYRGLGKHPKPSFPEVELHSRLSPPITHLIPGVLVGVVLLSLSLSLRSGTLYIAATHDGSGEIWPAWGMAGYGDLFGAVTGDYCMVSANYREGGEKSEELSTHAAEGGGYIWKKRTRVGPMSTNGRRGRSIDFVFRCWLLVGLGLLNAMDDFFLRKSIT